MVKPGDIYHRYDYDEGDDKVYHDTYVVRTIRRPYVHAIQKNEFTWGKRSRKHGDFGWLDPIWPGWRRRWRIGTQPYRLSPSKTGAIRKALAHLRKYNHSQPWFAIAEKRLSALLKKEMKK